MIYKTFAQIRSKVERELDLEGEEFVQPEEFTEYVNDGIAVAEAAIHKLGLEDEYFLTKYTLPLVNGQEDYALPASIYMNKIRSFMYRSGQRIYPINRLRGANKFLELEQINQNDSKSEFYQYLIRNDSAETGVVLQLVPPSYEDNANAAKIWFIREAAKMGTDETLKCDLPQIAMQFLYQYVKYRCYEKEGHANTADAKADLGAIETKMISTMEQMVSDDDTVLSSDLSSYEDLS